MIKVTFCLHRLPKLGLGEFHDYWLNKHGPLVRRLQPALGMVRYVQQHRLDNDLAAGMQRVRGAPEPYDGVAELWWRDEAAFTAARGPEAREAGRLLLEDEARFIDLERSPLWLNRENVIYSQP
jgi:uncharacterized protein (TIGR02118 family)